MDLFTQVVDSDVRGSTDEHLSWVHLGEVVDDRSGCDGLSCTGRSLNQTERFLQDFLDCCHLRMIEFGKIGRRESFGHLGSEDLGFKLVAEQLVVLKSAPFVLRDSRYNR